MGGNAHNGKAEIRFLRFQKSVEALIVNPDDDDLGATDFEAVCSSGIRLHHKSKPDWRPVTNRGHWSKEVLYWHCAKKIYIELNETIEQTKSIFQTRLV